MFTRCTASPTQPQPGSRNLDRRAVVVHTGGVVVIATFKNSKRIQGVRKGVFNYASMHCGYYVNKYDRSTSIGYNGLDLQVKIRFPSEVQASLFAHALQEFGGDDHPICSDISFQKDANDYDLSSRVLKMHYKSDDTESPPGTSSTSDAGISTPSSIDSSCQSVEDDCVVKHSCHMLGNKHPPIEGFPPHHKSSVSNRVSLSPTLHQLYDGHTGFAPVFAMKALDISPEPVRIQYGSISQTRYKVRVKLEFSSMEARRMYNGTFKSGHVMNSATDYELDMHVERPEDFKTFMNWKYDDTVQQWP